MSRNEALHAELKQSGVIDILTPLADAKCAAQLRVLMAMSYLIGWKKAAPTLAARSRSWPTARRSAKLSTALRTR